MTASTGEVRKLSSLLEITQALSATPKLREGLHRVLEILEKHHSAVRSAVVLTNDETGATRVEASLGSGSGRGAELAGSGIVERVIESGRHVVIPRASLEPSLKAVPPKPARGASSDRSIIAMPIVLSRKTIGALSVELPFKKDRDYERSAKFFGVVASSIAHAARLHRLVDAERQKLLHENEALRDELRGRYDVSNIIGNSGPMRDVYEQVAQVARSNTTVLVRGESGTGKELIAHALHYSSLRAKKPFVKVNCAALPETLIESELFGYERGAFTGAQARKKGRFELAEGGTLLLDEIGDLNPATQVKILRVLQEREFERLGGTESIKVNVRLIAATNTDLEQAIAEGRFRGDLYYRLNVFTIFVPPLRERKSDILLLADHFLEKYSTEHGKHIKRISTPAIDMLASYHWPGNVRELENTLERAVLVCDGDVVHGHHLPPTLQTAEASGTVTRVSLDEAVEAFERDIIMDALKSTRGNCAKAARMLSTTERIINYKIRKYGIETRRFRS